VFNVRRVLCYEKAGGKEVNIKELGGEFALIDRISRTPKNSAIVRGIGDDCAAERVGDRIRLYTVDMLVENDHFSLDYFTPYQIGWKAMLSNVSDIAACGGKVLYALVSIVLTDKIDVAFMDGFYKGIYDAAEKWGFDIIGGDTTHGALMSVSITLVGETTPENVRYRNTAKPGDLVAVSAPLGGSTAGLRLYLKKIPGFESVKKYHTNPVCGMDDLPQILPVSRAMSDVSDGLASEARNIARESGLSIHLDKKAIPLSVGIAESAALLGEDPYDYALFGGEDFALVYTLSKGSIPFGTIVGEVKEGEGVFLDGSKLSRFGYDHFA
jgi:thiamine-monophosphate kinase